MFWRYRNFLVTQRGIGVRKPLCQKPGGFLRSSQHRLVTDGQTDADAIEYHNVTVKKVTVAHTR